MSKYAITMSPDKVLTPTTVYNWRFDLKKELLKKRNFRSDFSGKLITEATGCHMHEGIVTRGMVPKSISWHLLIYSEVNCFLLLPEEHIPQPPSREWCLQKAYEYYGRDAVREWFYGLPWKACPFQLE